MDKKAMSLFATLGTIVLLVILLIIIVTSVFPKITGGIKVVGKTADCDGAVSMLFEDAYCANKCPSDYEKLSTSSGCQEEYGEGYVCCVKYSTTLT